MVTRSTTIALRGAGPAEILKNFRGYLQTDAYAAYELVVSESSGRIIPVGCWAHARREFFDARLNQPREAHHVLGLIALLYGIEDEVRLQSPDAQLAARQERSVPILDRLEAFLREQRDEALPKSQYGKAIGYALNHWEELRRFTENGTLEIDNNISERTLRLCAIGRTNWMFLGSDQGGETAAICFTILANAKHYKIEPFAYVKALLIALASAEVELESLLPDVWIAAHPEHVLKYHRDEAEAAAAGRPAAQDPKTRPESLTGTALISGPATSSTGGRPTRIIGSRRPRTGARACSRGRGRWGYLPRGSGGWPFSLGTRAVWDDGPARCTGRHRGCRGLGASRWRVGGRWVSWAAAAWAWRGRLRRGMVLQCAYGQPTVVRSSG